MTLVEVAGEEPKQIASAQITFVENNPQQRAASRVKRTREGPKVPKDGSSPTQTEKKQRARRPKDKIVRLFHCTIGPCTKSYGSDAALKIHVRQKHPEHFGDYDKLHRCALLDTVSVGVKVEPIETAAPAPSFASFALEAASPPPVVPLTAPQMLSYAYNATLVRPSTPGLDQQFTQVFSSQPAGGMWLDDEFGRPAKRMALGISSPSSSDDSDHTDGPEISEPLVQYNQHYPFPQQSYYSAEIPWGAAEPQWTS